MKASELFEIVTKHMIHNPCGIHELDGKTKSCMMKGECTKKYPKQFCNETNDLSNGYPQYRRRGLEQGGRVWNKQLKNSKYSIDNRCVVPYNPYLLMKYNSQ